MKNEHLNFHSGRHYFPDVPSLSFTALSLLFHCILITSSVHCHYFFTALSLLYTAITVSLHYHYCILPLLFHSTIITVSLQAWCHIPPCYIQYYHPVRRPSFKGKYEKCTFYESQKHSLKIGEIQILFHCRHDWCPIPPSYIMYNHLHTTLLYSCTIIISSQRASRFPSPPLRHIDPGISSHPALSAWSNLVRFPNPLATGSGLGFHYP